ncbi:TPA: VOC family protein [Bacillus pseudomycoides]|nr:VOC family protein [Bacillus pseudomycoides]
MIDLKLLQIRLLVKDFKKSAMFYRDILEFPVSWYEENMEYALFNNGETKIELVSRKVMAELVRERNKPLEAEHQSKFLLQCEVEDVDKTYNRLREKGIEFVNEPHDRKEWRARVAHFRDPDDNLIEIYKML